MISEILLAISCLRDVAKKLRHQHITKHQASIELRIVADALEKTLVGPEKSVFRAAENIDGFVKLFEFKKRGDRYWCKKIDRDGLTFSVYIDLLINNETVVLSIDAAHILETKNINTLIQFMHVLNLK